MFKWTRIATNLPFGFNLTTLRSDPTYLKGVKRAGAGRDKKTGKWGFYLRIRKTLIMLYQPIPCHCQGCQAAPQA